LDATAASWFPEEENDDKKPFDKNVNSSQSSSRLKQRKQNFDFSGSQAYLKTENPEFDDFKKPLKKDDISHESIHVHNGESWLQKLREKTDSKIRQTVRSISHSESNESDVSLEDDTADGLNDNANGDEAKNEDKDKDILISEMNAFLRKLPTSFNFVIPFKDFHSVCYRTDVQLETKKKTKPISAKKIVFLRKTGHNLISKHFKVTNPYCGLSFYKKNLKQDIEITPRSSAQLILYANCTNPLCNGKFSFTIKKVPVREKAVLVKVK